MHLWGWNSNIFIAEKIFVSKTKQANFNVFSAGIFLIQTVLIFPIHILQRPTDSGSISTPFFPHSLSFPKRKIKKQTRKPNKQTNKQMKTEQKKKHRNKNSPWLYYKRIYCLAIALNDPQVSPKPLFSLSPLLNDETQ